jgi:hypothetical protein
MHFVIDHAEQGPEEAPEPVPAEGTNPQQEQGKPQCIEPPTLNICLPFLSHLWFFIVHYIVRVGLIP